MSESKIWTLKWLDPLILFLLNKLAILGKKQLLVTLDIFGFFHQIMQLAFLANRIKDQAVLIHLEISSSLKDCS